MKKKKRNPNEPLGERDTRLSIFADCNKHFGPEAERQLRMVFDKWDNVLSKCTNDKERKHIQIMAATEVHQLMRYPDGLVVGGKVIIEPEKQ
jgi:UPF0288 family protein (methanogenesis marker protein 3)